MFTRIGQYRPRFRGYYLLCALVHVADGLLSLAAWPFGWQCDLHVRFSEWNLRKDVERTKRERALRNLEKDVEANGPLGGKA